MLFTGTMIMLYVVVFVNICTTSVRQKALKIGSYCCFLHHRFSFMFISAKSQVSRVGQCRCIGIQYWTNIGTMLLCCKRRVLAHCQTRLGQYGYSVTVLQESAPTISTLDKKQCWKFVQGYSQLLNKSIDILLFLKGIRLNRIR